MDRVCGASVERDRLSQSRCWCRGLFCGRGGARLSREFRRDFHVTGHAASLKDLSTLMGQLDLIDGDAKCTKWVERMRRTSKATAGATA